MPITYRDGAASPECVRRNHNSTYTLCPYTGAPIIKKRALSDAFRALRAHHGQRMLRRVLKRMAREHREFHCY